MFLGHQMTRSDTFACSLMYRPLMPKKLTISFSGYINCISCSCNDLFYCIFWKGDRIMEIFQFQLIKKSKFSPFKSCYKKTKIPVFVLP